MHEEYIPTTFTRAAMRQAASDLALAKLGPGLGFGSTNVRAGERGEVPVIGSHIFAGLSNWFPVQFYGT